MKIALITREYPPETAWGGIGTFYSVFASALAQAGHRVEVFTQGLTENRTDAQNGVIVHRIVPRKWVVGPRVGGDLAGMGVPYIGSFAMSLAMAMAQALLSRNRTSRFDLVEGHEHLGINAIVNIAGQRSFATVTRYHVAYHSLVSRGLEQWPASLLITRLERLSIRSAHTRVASSAFIDEMTRQDFPGVPCCDHVLPLMPDSAPECSASSISKREKLLIFVGRLVPGLKNPEIAAEVFASLAERFPDWRIEFAGQDIGLGNGSTAWGICESKLQAYPGRYCYHGQLSSYSLRELYRRARITLMPSSFESFGLVALESMTAGTIPIVADSTALPEVVGDGGVVFRNGSITDLRSKLTALMQDESEQIRLSELALGRSAGEVSQERILVRNVELFEELVVAQRRKWL